MIHWRVYWLEFQKKIVISGEFRNVLLHFNTVIDRRIDSYQL